jgi:hypothetical protein
MRSVLHLNKLIATSCVIFFIVLTSCHHHLYTCSPAVIHIVDGDTASGKLDLRDVNGISADTFKVPKGADIRWLLGNNQVVIKITNIYKKPASVSDSIFSSQPDSIGGSSLNWKAKIDQNAGGKTEIYNMDWIDKHGQPHTFDPKIQVML